MSLVLAAIACSSEDAPLDAGFVDASTAPDAGLFTVDISPPLAPALPMIDEAALIPAEPAPAALPIFTPCPPGWREVADGEVTLCEPWPAGGRRTCAGDEAHYPGEPGCVTIGTACDPSDPWATDLPASDVLYVMSGAAPGGNGSRNAPFATIAEALAGPPNTTIALAKGTYHEPIVLGGGRSIAGACVAETTLTATIAGVNALVELSGAGSELRNVTLASAIQPAVWISAAGMPARVRGVAITAARSASIYAESGSATIEDVSIANPGAQGIQAAGTAALTLSRVQIAGAFTFGIRNGELSTIDGAEVSVVRPRLATDPIARPLATAGRVSFVRSVFETSPYDVYATGGFAELELTDSIIRETTLRGDGERGYGILATDNARVRLTRVQVRDVGAIGIVIGVRDVSLDATDVAILDVAEPGPIITAGGGLLLDNAGHARLERVLIARVTDTGLVVRAGATVIANDLTITDTLPHAAAGTRGLELQAGSSLQLDRARFERHERCAVSLRGGDATINDLVVTESGGPAFPMLQNPPFGALFADSGRIAITRSRFDRNKSFSLYLVGVNVELADLEITNAIGTSGVLAGGIYLTREGVATIRRASFANNMGWNVFVPNSTLSMEDVAIRDAQQHLDLRQLGEAIVFVGNAHGDLSRILIERARSSGIELTTPMQDQAGTIMARDIIVRDLSESDERENAWGVQCRGLCDVTLDRVLIERSRYEGIKMEGAIGYDGQTRGVFRDVTVRDVRPLRFVTREVPEAGEVLGGAIGVFGIGADLSIERLQIEGVMAAGLVLSDSSTVAVSDVEIRRSIPNEVGFYGRALSLETGSNGTIARAVIEDAFEVGVFAGRSVHATIEDLVVRRVAKSACEDPRCAIVAAAAGIGVIRGSAVTVRRFSISESATAGVIVASGSTMDLYDGLITKNPIGANIQDSDLDPARLSNNVVYEDNGVGLDARTLPVPKDEVDL